MTSPPSPEVVGHGGTGSHYPGNSRPAIELALKIGVDRIECDVQRSSDGVLVLGHDEHVVINGAKRALRGLNLHTLRLVLVDLLTIDELLELVGKQSSFLLDMKAPGYERELADAVQRHDVASRTVVSSTYALGLLQLGRLIPGLSTGLSSGHLASGLPTERLRQWMGAALGWLTPRPIVLAAQQVGATHLMIHHRACSTRMVELAHASGLRVYPWTVDDEVRMDDLIELSVDGIISNKPDVLKQRLSDSTASRRG